MDEPPDLSSVLIDGFGVGQFELTRGAGGTFQYEKPSGAVLVECALFRCHPQTQLEAVNQSSRVVISNFNRCVISYETSDAQSGIFDPSSDAYQQPDQEYGAGFICRSGDPFPGKFRPFYSELEVGCWAYDEGRLIAATLVLPIDFKAVTNIAGTGTSVGGCTSAADGTDCLFDPVTATIGSCLAGSCLARCLWPVDCELHASPTDTTGTGLGDDSDAGDAAASGDAAPQTPVVPLVCPWQCAYPLGPALGLCEKVSM